MDRPEIRVDPTPILSLPRAGAQIQRDELMSLETQWSVQVATRSRTGNAHKATLIVSDSESKNASGHSARSREINQIKEPR